MSSKPLVIPLFCTTGSRVTPPSDFIEDGLSPGISWPAQYGNHTLGNLGDWAQYLSDGDLEGAHSFADAVTFGAGAVAAANQDIEVSGTGKFKHGERQFRFSPASASGGTAFNGYHRIGASGSGFIGLQGIPEGAEITGFEQVVRHSLTASVSVSLNRFDTSSPTIINSGDDSKSCTANIWTSKVVTGLSEVVSGSRHYYIAVGNLGGNTDLGLLKVTWRIP